MDFRWLWRSVRIGLLIFGMAGFLRLMLRNERKIGKALSGRGNRLSHWMETISTVGRNFLHYWKKSGRIEHDFFEKGASTKAMVRDIC